MHEEVDLAIYSVNLRTFSRSKGESAVAAAAYRAGAALADTRTGLTHDYTRRHGVESVETLLPPGAPAWAADRTALWNAAEAAETRKNSCVARELLVALPHELPPPQRLNLARAIGRHLVDTYHVAVLVAVHAPDRAGDDRNAHAHLLLTTRVLTPHGLAGKVRCLDDKTQGPLEVKAIRAKVAELTNAALAAGGSSERVDHRTLVAQAKEAEANGDFWRAALLTREPMRRVSRADVEAVRRGERRRSVEDNRRRRQEHAERMLMFRAAIVRTHFASAPASLRTRQVEGRYNPQRVSGGGKNTAQRTVQARQLAEQERVGERLGRMYLAELERTVRDGQRWFAAYLKFTGQRHALESWLSKCEDRRAWELFRSTIETHRSVRREKAKALLKLRAWQHGTRARQRIQWAGASRKTVAPPAQHQRGVWLHERQVYWRRLRAAIAHERSARAGSEAAKVAAQAEVRRLRGQLSAFESALQARAAVVRAQSSEAVTAVAGGVRPASTPPSSFQPPTRSP